MRYKICKRCVMDTSDKDIKFDSFGICDHCKTYDSITKPLWEEQLSNKKSFNQIITKIKKSKKGKYDCILGLSGGIDSSYMLHYAVTELNLNPLVFHVDGGWNSDISTSNIQLLTEKLSLDLFTEVINWEEMRKFQLAFFKSGVPHLDLPQDHAFIAVLYKYAAKHNIKWILNGGNCSTEAVRNPLNWYWYGTDMKHIRAIRNSFGAKKMPTYPFSSILGHKLWLRYFRRIKVFKLLDYIPYIKSNALNILKDEYNWKPYPQKHFESRFTRYIEGYWLPHRFGIDTRRTQFSSLILSGQMKREDALKLLETPAIDDIEAEKEGRFIAEKLYITYDELLKYRDMNLKYYYDYPHSYELFDLGSKFLRKIGAINTFKR